MRTVTAILFLAASILAQTASAAPVQERATLSMSEICPTWQSTCVAACADYSSTATASSSCTLSTRVSRRALGSMSCKCNSKDLTAKVLSSYLSVSTSGASTPVFEDAEEVAQVEGEAAAPVSTMLSRNAIVAGAEATLLVAANDILAAAPSSTSTVDSGAVKLVANNAAAAPTPAIAVAAAAATSSSTKKSSTKKTSTKKTSTKKTSTKKTSTKKTSTKKTATKKTVIKITATSTSTPTPVAAAAAVTTTAALNKVNAYVEQMIPINDAW